MEKDIYKINFGGYIFNISASSFYQVNPIQTEKLYKLAVEGAGLSKEDIIFDLYCGIGTIGNSRRSNRKCERKCKNK